MPGGIDPGLGRTLGARLPIGWTVISARLAGAELLCAEVEGPCGYPAPCACGTPGCRMLVDQGPMTLTAQGQNVDELVDAVHVALVRNALPGGGA